jgi:hypothetical protein
VKSAGEKIAFVGFAARRIFFTIPGLLLFFLLLIVAFYTEENWRGKRA